MYKRLYEEEHKLHSSHTQYIEAAPGSISAQLNLLALFYPMFNGLVKMLSGGKDKRGCLFG